MPALHPQAVVAPGPGGPRNALLVRRPGRLDTLIAFAVLAVLLAGWMLNLTSVKDLTLGLGGYLVQAAALQV